MRVKVIKEKRTRLCFDCPDELLQHIKTMAAYHNCFVREYVLEAILERMAREKRFVLPNHT